MILEADTIPILVSNLTCVVECGILVDNGWCRFQNVHKEHTKEKTYQKWQELEMVEELHFPYR